MRGGPERGTLTRRQWEGGLAENFRDLLIQLKDTEGGERSGGESERKNKGQLAGDEVRKRKRAASYEWRENKELRRCIVWKRGKGGSHTGQRGDGKSRKNRRLAGGISEKFS